MYRPITNLHTPNFSEDFSRIGMPVIHKVLHIPGESYYVLNPLLKNVSSKM